MNNIIFIFAVVTALSMIGCTNYKFESGKKTSLASLSTNTDTTTTAITTGDTGSTSDSTSATDTSTDDVLVDGTPTPSEDVDTDHEYACNDKDDDDSDKDDNDDDVTVTPPPPPPPTDPDVTPPTGLSTLRTLSSSAADSHSDGKSCDKGEGQNHENEKPEKVLVCHVPPGNPEAQHEICISKNALAAHLGERGQEDKGKEHKDYLGHCQPADPDTGASAE